MLDNREEKANVGVALQARQTLSMVQLNEIAALSSEFLQSSAAEFSEEDILLNLASLAKLSEQGELPPCHAKKVMKLAAFAFGSFAGGRHRRRHAQNQQSLPRHFHASLMEDKKQQNHSTKKPASTEFENRFLRRLEVHYFNRWIPEEAAKLCAREYYDLAMKSVAAASEGDVQKARLEECSLEAFKENSPDWKPQYTKDAFETMEDSARRHPELFQMPTKTPRTRETALSTLLSKLRSHRLLAEPSDPANTLTEELVAKTFAPISEQVWKSVRGKVFSEFLYLGCGQISKQVLLQTTAFESAMPYPGMYADGYIFTIPYSQQISDSDLIKSAVLIHESLHALAGFHRSNQYFTDSGRIISLRWVNEGIADFLSERIYSRSVMDLLRIKRDYVGYPLEVAVFSRLSGVIGENAGTLLAYAHLSGDLSPISAILDRKLGDGFSRTLWHCKDAGEAGNILATAAI